MQLNISDSGVVVLKDVHVYYGASHILRGIDLNLALGSCLSLIKRNGMGKTTTLKAIMGLIKTRHGKVTIKGKPSNSLAPNVIASMGVAYVPEERAIFPNLTVRENLLVAARSSLDGREGWNLDRVLSLFPRLSERLSHWGNHLSGGEQQMLTISRALMTNPDVLLLDEVTEGLAPLIREEIWSVIEIIKGEGVAILIVDKNINKLMALADQHLIMVKGRLVFTGDSKTLSSQPELLQAYLGI